MLRTELTWSFGGKPQRGWYLYDLLLTKTLDTQSDATTAGFAAAVADWQKRRGLAPNGVLDEKPLMAIVSHWQSNRLKTRTPADPSQLMTAPPADFYDPGRAAELRQVEHNTYAAYKEMIAAAMADPSLKLKSSDRFLKIISSYRSRECLSVNLRSAGTGLPRPFRIRRNIGSGFQLHVCRGEVTTVVPLDAGLDLEGDRELVRRDLRQSGAQRWQHFVANAGVLRLAVSEFKQSIVREARELNDAGVATLDQFQDG